MRKQWQGKWAVTSQMPWSGLKCCQWQSDVPLNRITLKVSCHHIPASHYQGQGGLWDDREWLGKAFPRPNWAWAPRDARQKMRKRLNRWGVIGPTVEMLMKLWAERNTWMVAANNQQKTARSFKTVCSPSWKIHCQNCWAQSNTTSDWASRGSMIFTETQLCYFPA